MQGHQCKKVMRSRTGVALPAAGSTRLKSPELKHCKAAGTVRRRKDQKRIELGLDEISALPSGDLMDSTAIPSSCPEREPRAENTVCQGRSPSSGFLQSPAPPGHWRSSRILLWFCYLNGASLKLSTRCGAFLPSGPACRPGLGGRKLAPLLARRRAGLLGWFRLPWPGFWD